MFKVGQTVWCIQYGKGEVLEVDRVGPYPIKVTSERGGHNTYTGDGRLVANSPVRNLYFSEPRIVAEMEPPFKPTLELGTQLWVEDKNVVSKPFIITVDVEHKHSIKSCRGHSYLKSEYSFFKKGEAIC